MEDYILDNSIFFKSKKSIYYSLLESLKEDGISTIGLFGLGGCGKTTFIKQVAKGAEQLFDRVVFVVVSSNPNVRKIQEQIATSLDLQLPEESKLGRARHLFMRLASGERILLILDDVWDRPDLEGIGIPFGFNNKACSMLITTRNKQVCIMMECQRMFSLPLLTDELAWTLLQKHSQITEETSDSLKDVARKVTQECRGLPVAIAAVATSLKGKTEDNWMKALEELQRPMNTEVDQTLSRIELRYSNLANEHLKSFLFLCSVFPEDFEIHEEYLMRYGIVLGLFGEASSYERARSQVSVAKEKLRILFVAPSW